MGSVAVRGYAPALFFIILGGLLWGWIGATGRNPLSDHLGKRVWIVYALVGLSAVYIAWIGRNAYLPFLGPTVFPCAALSDKTPEGASTSYTIQTRPGAKIIYWAAEPSLNTTLESIQSWRQAYGGFENVGITTADVQTGKATLLVRGPPQSYTVPMRGEIDAHIHYRICLEDGGLGQVETVFTTGATHKMDEPFQQQEGVELNMQTLGQTSENQNVDPIQALESQFGPFGTQSQIDDSTDMSVTEPDQSNFDSLRTLESFEETAPSQHISSNEHPVSVQQIANRVMDESARMFDPLAFQEGAQIGGSDIEAAFESPKKPSRV